MISNVRCVFECMINEEVFEWLCTAEMSSSLITSGISCLSIDDLNEREWLPKGWYSLEVSVAS